jgi:hypothetical protein
MKKIFSVLVILCWLALPALPQPQQTQPQPPRQQRRMQGMLETMKTGFIVRRLDLTSEQAQRFFPIYDNFSKENQQAYNHFKSQPNGSEIDLEEALLTIKKKYAIEFLKAISPAQINELWLAEKDFNRFVQREMQRRQMQQQRAYPQGPPPGPQGP